MTRPAFNLEMVEAGTRAALAEGKHRVLQTHYYGADDYAHVGAMLRMMWPLPLNPTVLDAGCGFGEVSKLMAERVPSARFILANLSQLQLDQCPRGPRFTSLLADCHALPIASASVDVVMFSSALSQMDEAVALGEAARVIRRRGVLLVNEMVHFGGGNDALEQAVACRVMRLTDLLRAVEDAGFRSIAVHFPLSDNSHFRQMLREANIEHGLDDVRACVIRAERAA